MKDTSEEIELIYTQMFMEKSGEDKFRVTPGQFIPQTARLNAWPKTFQQQHRT